MFALALGMRGAPARARPGPVRDQPLTTRRSAAAWPSRPSSDRLLALPAVSRALDPHALETYLAVNAVMAMRTMLLRCAACPPGHLLVAGTGSRRSCATPALPRPADRQRREPERELAVEARDRLSRSVARTYTATCRSGAPLGGLIRLIARWPPVPPASRCAPSPSLHRAGVRTSSRRPAGRATLRDRAPRVPGAEAADELAAGPRRSQPRCDATALRTGWPRATRPRRSSRAVRGGGDELFGGYRPTS